jgi:cephalosporin-C deacetylase-like acetyl esterase
MSRRKDVEFEAGDGIKLWAWLVEPTAGRCPYPAITMAHGYAGVRGHGIEPFARALSCCSTIIETLEQAKGNRGRISILGNRSWIGAA